MPVDRSQPVYPPSKGEDILAQWGDDVSEHVVQRFASTGDRDAKWANPPRGAACVTIDTTPPALWIYDGTNWQRRANPSSFQTHAERDGYWGNSAPKGETCRVRLCEFFWDGTKWVPVPFMQGGTTVLGPDPRGGYAWGIPIPYQAAMAHNVVASNAQSNTLVTMADPAGYNSNIEVRWNSFNMPPTWRWEVHAMGYLDGYS